MKTRIIEVIGVLATVLCLALTGCDMSNTPQGVQSSGAKGTVRVFVSTDAESLAQTNSRTVVPENPGFTYTLAIINNTTDVLSESITLNGNKDGDKVLLKEGNWKLKVKVEKQGKEVATADPVIVIVFANGAVSSPSVSITIRPITAVDVGGPVPAGTFSYIISTTNGINIVSVALTPLQGTPTDPIALPVERGEQAVAPGYYRLTVSAMKGTQPLIRQEVVHIYSYTETYKFYNLTDTDFASAFYLGGTLNTDLQALPSLLNLSTSLSGPITPTAVRAYADAEGSVFIAESAVDNSGEWRLVVGDTLVYCKVKLENNGSVYYSKPVAVTNFPAIGDTDIKLSVEPYTITFHANGGYFGNEDNNTTTITKTALENQTLTLPEPPTLPEYTFVRWYSASKHFTDTTPITGATTEVYAGWVVDPDPTRNDIVTYLSKAPGGFSPDDPVLLPLKAQSELVNNSGIWVGWEAILSALATARKYVELDLSDCIMAMQGDKVFTPGTNAGAEWITTLILPTVAQSIAGRNWNTPTFSAFTALKSISGTGVKTVNSFAFSGYTSLESVSLSATDIISIDDYAFFGCTSLTSIDLPSATSITIGASAFSDCTSLASIDLSTANSISIGVSAFSDCTSLSSVDLSKMTAIDDYVFSGCTGLTEVILSSTTTTIGTSTFYGCTSLSSVDLSYVDTIGDYAFYDCRLLGFALQVDLSNAQTIGARAFSGCERLTTVTLPLADTIGDEAFFGCRYLTTVTLSQAITIGDEAFFGCPRLTTVTLPLADTIGDKAFSGCTSLETVKMPQVTTIGAQAFYGCTSITSVTDTANGPTPVVTLPQARTIGAQAFFGCTLLASVKLPAADTIDAQAFSGCTSLTTVTLASAADIGAQAFSGCTSLTTMNLPATPPNIELEGAIFSNSYVTDGGPITIKVPTVAAVSLYTTAWGVKDAGSDPLYGDSHKRVAFTMQ
jgi:hypothetical protein